MVDVLFGKVSKLAYHTTKTGKAYIKFCLTENRKTMDDKFGKDWFHCTFWNTKDNLADGQFAVIYGHNTKNPDKNDPNKFFNNFDVEHIEIVTQTQSLPSDLKTVHPYLKTVPDDIIENNDTKKRTPISHLDDVPF